jgi:hypothetical protein
LILADLYNTLSSHDLAIQVIRKGCRWLQGRARQGYWDGVEDDREWDPDLPGFNRAARVAAAAQMGVHVGVEDDNEGGGSGSGRVIGGTGSGGANNVSKGRQLEPGRYPLDVNARHRLAVARIKLGEIEEGKVCLFLSLRPYERQRLTILFLPFFFPVLYLLLWSWFVPIRSDLPALRVCIYAFSRYYRVVSCHSL